MELTTAAELYDKVSIPAFPLLMTSIIIAIALPIAALVGHSMGRSERERKIAKGKEIDEATGQTTLGAILTLLGLLLAFSFGNSLSETQIRKTTIIQEAATLGTAFLRADYLEEPGRSELKRALLDYSKTRIKPTERNLDSVEKFQQFLERSLKAQAKLWPLTLKVTADPVPPATKAFVAGAVNDVLDAHLVRLQSLSVPITDYAQIMLFLAAIAALFMLGNRAGSIGRDLSWRTFVFSFFLLVVMITISDFQRGEDGWIRTDQTALSATIFEMELALQ